MAFDLILQTREPIADEVRDALAQLLRSDVLRFCEISVSATESEFELDELEEYLEEDPDMIEIFEDFCESRKLDPKSDEAATAFLCQEYGYTHAVVKMPRETEHAISAFAELMKIANQLSLTIHDPQIGYDIDDDYAEQLPPGW